MSEQSPERANIDLRARVGTPEFERLLDAALSKFGTLYCLGNKNNSDRAALLLKTNHGTEHDIDEWRKDRSELTPFIRHQDFVYLALRQMSRGFAAENRIRFILEAFYKSGPEWDNEIKQHLGIVAAEDNQRRAGNTLPFESCIHKMLEGGPKATSYLSSLQGSVRFAAQCYTNNVPHLILSGKPAAEKGSSLFFKCNSPLRHIAVLAKQARTRAIDITELEAVRDTWREKTDEDHKKLHAHYQSQAATVPKNGIAVCETGADHVAYGYHQNAKSVSRFPLEGYLQDNFHMFVFEPNEYRESCEEKEEGQLRLYSGNMTVEEIRDALSFLFYRPN